LAVASNIDDDLLKMTALGRQFDLVCTAERLSISQIRHSGGTLLGLTIAWINRRDVGLRPDAPVP